MTRISADRTKTTRNSTAYNEAYDMITKAETITALTKAVEKSMQLISQYKMDEIQRNKLEHIATRKYEQITTSNMRLANEMRLNKRR